MEILKNFIWKQTVKITRTVIIVVLILAGVHHYLPEVLHHSLALTFHEALFASLIVFAIERTLEVDKKQGTAHGSKHCGS